VLKRLHLERLRSFEELDLSFRVNQTLLDRGQGWTILVGENGVGKTTILQAVVLAAIDTRGVSAVVEAPWTLVRQGTPDEGHALVRLTIGENGGSSDWVEERRVPAEPGSYIEATQTREDQEPFLVAFAARRRIARLGETTPTENPALERVRGLFDTDQPLLRDDVFKAFDSDAQRRRFAAAVRSVLVTRGEGDTALFPLINSFELRGQGGITRSKQLLEGRRFELLYGDRFKVRVALQDLSDGYQSMFALVTEILVQAALATDAVPDPATLEATVLIDEIEAHLHPRWQNTIVPLLRSVFPRCQFIVTTHSPLVAASAEPGEVHVLSVTPEGAVEQDVLDERLAMQGADRIYEEVFGVYRSAPPDLVKKERDYLHQTQTGAKPDPALADLIESSWRDAK
jgi:hypothetical protein